jgi:hypothetical protein
MRSILSIAPKFGRMVAFSACATRMSQQAVVFCFDRNQERRIAVALRRFSVNL